MSIFSDIFTSRLNSSSSPSRFPLYFFAGAACLGIAGTLTFARKPAEIGRPTAVPSPLESVLPRLSKKEIEELPYPPDVLPGGRDVETPYGSIRVYEWGPDAGSRVVLIHGISTPSIALYGLAKKLAEKGCRVMLFGR